jgi:DedD protein
MAKIDGEDELKRQMRRRLVGAVALVTALVVILPWLLEGSPRQREGGLELRIPDKDKAGAFTSQMVLAESAPDVAPEPASGAQAGGVPAAVSAVPPVPLAAPTPAAKPAKPEPPHAPAPSGHKAERKPGFAVQVGAFSHAAGAKELQDKLRKHGWHVYTEKSGETIRVRVGPYPARADAEKAQHKLVEQGVKPAAVVAEP